MKKSKSIVVDASGIDPQEWERNFIATGHRKAQFHGVAAVAYGVLTGIRLARKKRELSGKYLKWLSTTDIPERTAATYTRAARDLAAAGKLDELEPLLEQCDDPDKEPEILLALAGIISSKSLAGLLSEINGRLSSSQGNPEPTKEPEDDDDPDPWANARAAFSLVGRPVIMLEESRVDPEKFRKALLDLPIEDVLDDDGRPLVVGLSNLESSLSSIRTEIRSVLKLRNGQ